MVARRLRPLVAVLVAVVVGASTLGVLPAAAEDVAPTITLHPVSTTATSLETVTLTADASPYTSVKWQRRTVGASTWSDVSGATSTTFATNYSFSREVRAVFTNGAATTATDVAVVTYYGAPSISGHPQPISKAPGTSATLSASYTCSCPAPATGTWQRSTDGGATWTPLAGGTVWPSPATYPFSPLTLDDAGRYRVVLTNGPAAPTTSNSALVTLGEAPAVTLDGHLEGAEDTSRTLTATVTKGYPAPTLQWQESTDYGATYSDIEGETGTTFTRTLTVEMHTHYVRAVATNAFGSVPTPGRQIRVGIYPAITSRPPGNVYEDVGDEIVLVTTASGQPEPTVEWTFKAPGANYGSPIPGATDPTYSFILSSATAGTYEAVYTNRVGSIGAKVGVWVGTPGTVAVSPSTRSVSVGQMATFNASQPVQGLPGVSYSWERSLDGGETWELLPNSGMNLSVPSAIELDGAQYRATVTNAFGTATSNVVTLLISPSPGVTKQPVQQKVAIGAPATFTATAAGSPTPSVQWQRSNDGGSTWADIDGATATTYTFATTLADDSSRYRAVFTNVHGSATSSSALLRVGFPTGTLVEVQPYVYGSTLATFSIVDVTGSPAPTITWHYFWSGGCFECFGSFEVGSGPTANIGTGNGSGPFGYYYVEIKNSLGTVTLYPSPRQASAPVVTSSPESVTAAPGSEVTFSAAASGVPAPAVQWDRSTDGGTSWEEVAGATSGSLTVVVPEGGPDPRYRARFTNLAGTATTDVAVLERDGSVPVVSALLSSANEPVGGAYGGPVTVALEASDDRALESITWSASGATVAGPTTVSGGTAGLVVDAVGTTTVSFTARDAAGNVSELQTVDVTVVGAPAAPAGLKAALGNGSSVVSWTAPAAANVVTGYRITPYVGSVAQAPQVFGAGTTALVTGLTNGVSYRFRVAALNAWGAGPEAQTAAVTVGVPTHPSSLRGTGGDGLAQLTWVAPPDMGVAPTGYRITPYLGATALPSTTVGPVLSATITGLTNGSTYTFRIVTLSPHGESVSANFPATTVGVLTHPGSLRTTPGNGQAVLTWVAPPSLGIPITGYRITPYLGATELPATTVGPVLSATITGLTNGSTYTFRIVTLWDKGTSAHATFPATTIGVLRPPTSLKATSGDGQAALTWLAPPFQGISPSGYRITPYLGATPLPAVTVGTVLAATVTGLTNGSTYTFRVVSLSGFGTSTYTISAPVTIGVATYPGARRATSGDNEARLLWKAPPSMGVAVTGYRITPYLGATALPATTVGPVTEATITGLTNGSTYTFRIVTLTEHGASTHATFPATTIGIPTHPGTLRAFPGDSQVRLTWVAPASIGIEPTGYRITPYIGSTALDPITVGPVLTTTITGLTNGTTYTFRIVTLSPHGESVSAGFPAATPTAP